ncbi:hypothetical protein ACO0SA_000690 [Hanseniaspora valbyensis]
MTSVKNKFIDGMRQVANQVMILTTNSNKTSITNAKDFRGVTLSSCVSLAMKPYPMLQFNLMKPSFTSNVLHSSEPYRIALHSLPPTEKSTKLAKLFSKGANIQPLINSTWNKLEHSKNKLKTLFDELDKREKLINKQKLTEEPEVKHIVTPFEPFTLLPREDYAFYEDKVPFLKNANVVFICETIPKMQFNVGDHEIWCVKVIDVLNPLSEGIKEENKGGLLYCNKNFYSLNSTTI